jgi:DNA-binding NtrC family response regulator
MINASVLVVENDPDICDILAEMLASLGFDPVCALCPSAAQREAEARRFDVALIDIMFPNDITGIELADRLGAFGIAVVLMSGDYQSLETASAAGYPILSKPFRFEDAVRILLASLEGYSRAV